MKLWRSFYIKHTQLVYFLHIYTVPSFYDSLTTQNENNKYIITLMKKIINIYVSSMYMNTKGNLAKNNIILCQIDFCCHLENKIQILYLISIVEII